MSQVGSSLNGKIALITGSASGIGNETALLFSDLGAYIALAGKNEKHVMSTVLKCEENGAYKTLSIVADVSTEKDMNHIIEATVQHFGTIDILVIATEGIEHDMTEMTPLQKYDNIMNVNVRVPYCLTMLAVPYLTKCGGTVINVSDFNNIKSTEKSMAYDISEAAMEQFTRSLALELAPSNVKIYNIRPDKHTDCARSEVTREKKCAQLICNLVLGNTGFPSGATVPVEDSDVIS